MPASDPIPGVTDFLGAFADDVAGDASGGLRARRGGILDLEGGSAALLWAAEGQRDAGLFRQCYTDTAAGAALKRQVEARYGVEPIVATYGTGKLALRRPAPGSVVNTIDIGTRVEVLGGPVPVAYAVSDEVVVPMTALVVEVPIRATQIGTGVAVHATSGLRLADSIFDPTFLPVSLVCADGTDDEAPGAYVARARAEALQARVGYATSVEAACLAAGAAQVVILDPGAYGPALDQAVTNVYVADNAWTSPPALLTACMVAIDAVRVAGCDAQLLPMVNVPVTLAFQVTLWAAPSRFNLIDLAGAVVAASLAVFADRPDFWLFDADSLAGAAFAAMQGAAQDLSVTSTPAPPAPGFPGALPRYTLNGNGVSITWGP
jgi:hypothetical protein